MSQLSVPLTPADIKEIANDVIQPFGHKDMANAPAAVTYLAQMIAHDIVPSTSKRHLDRNSYEISSYLNLDSIYGACKGCLERRHIVDSSGRFTYRRNRNMPFPYGFDFARTTDLTLEQGAQEVANTPEQRNDENIIISQLTVLWMRLHNMLLNAGYASSFEQAQEYVIKTFQLVAIEYVLANVSERTIFDHYFRNTNYVPFDIDLTQGLPTFFSHASFRFGHSMVRNEYILSIDSQTNKETRVNVAKIFQKHRLISQGLHIDFKIFFESSPTQMLAQEIDTNVVRGMSTIGQQTNSHAHLVNIVERNLQASLKMGLETGKEIHRRFNQQYMGMSIGKLLTKKELQQTQIPSKYFKNLPLWLYMLAEAEAREAGKTLGKLGSVLNIEVLRAAIADCPISVYVDNRYNYHRAATSMGNWGQQLLKLKPESQNMKNHLMAHIFDLIVEKEPK